MSNTSRTGPEPTNPTCTCKWAAECTRGTVYHARKLNAEAKPLCFSQRLLDENV